MNAASFLFPVPRSLFRGKGRVRLPQGWRITGASIPVWLRERLKRSCARARVRLAADARATLELRIQARLFPSLKNPELRAQAYELRLDRGGSVVIESPSDAGLRHGLITLCQLVEAAGGGAVLSPLKIRDHPSFAVRGIQVDLAREFFPPMAYLKKLVNRAVDLKLNTLWLYLENHFRAPGLEDLSPKKGMTPAQAREISAYAAERGVDVVPGTNLLSHMEGWFRLERYSDLCDGPMRSYPVLTREEAFRLTTRFADEMARAFPSKNFHAGLDELLFTGSNPEAARAIQKRGKAAYFARFARRMVLHLQSRGKRVWYWDDMVVGKNVFRKEGLNEDAPRAFRAIPKDTVMTHWYYWTDEDGKHAPIFRRVVKAGRPFVVAPSDKAQSWNYGHFQKAVENQAYLARLGVKHGAFGYVCTQWEARCGHSFEASWPFLAFSAGYAWSGGIRWEKAAGAFSFALCGDFSGALVEYLRVLQKVEDFLFARMERNPLGFRSYLISEGPQVLWARYSPALAPRDFRVLDSLLKRASQSHARLGTRDPGLKEALRLPLVLFGEGLRIVTAFDQAWAHYHRAALAERRAGKRKEFRDGIHGAVAQLRRAMEGVANYRAALLGLEKTGHTSYDSYALGRHLKNMAGVLTLIGKVVREDYGLPYFERLINLPDAYHHSNLQQLRIQNTFHPLRPSLLWPVRKECPKNR